ncbi:hypothetical protein EJ110_NYTH58970 [Nymphaea thermarum]|nr:hypothetical protein EJ110_NYTH58970 [Nymphaea thermarum]
MIREGSHGFHQAQFFIGEAFYASTALRSKHLKEGKGQNLFGKDGRERKGKGGEGLRRTLIQKRCRSHRGRCAQLEGIGAVVLRYQLPSDPATGSVEDPAPAETPASNPDAAVDKPVAMPPPSPDSASEKLNTVPSTWNNRFYTGYVGSALSSNMITFFQTPSGSWSHEVPFVDVHITGNRLRGGPQMIQLSLDDIGLLGFRMQMERIGYFNFDFGRRGKLLIEMAVDCCAGRRYAARLAEGFLDAKYGQPGVCLVDGFVRPWVAAAVRRLGVC